MRCQTWSRCSRSNCQRLQTQGEPRLAVRLLGCEQLRSNRACLVSAPFSIRPAHPCSLTICTPVARLCRCGAGSGLDSLLSKLGQLKALAIQQLQGQQEPAPLQARQHCTNYRPHGTIAVDAALRSQPGQRPAPAQQFGSSAESIWVDAGVHAAAGPCSPSGASGSRYTVAAEGAASAPRLVALPGERAPVSTQQRRQASAAQCAPSGAPAPAGSACGGAATAGASRGCSTSPSAGSCAWRLLQLRRPQERPQPRRLLATAAVRAGAAAGREGAGTSPAAG